MAIRHCVTTLLAAGALLSVFSARAQDVRLEGVFVNPTQSEQPIKAAVDAAAAQFNFLVRSIARRRLLKTNPNITRVAIARSGDDITIALGASKPSTAKPGGAPIKWSLDDETYDLALAWEGTTLTQSFTAPDGKRLNRYSVSPDGNTLSLEIALTSEMLKQPVKYVLTFSRESLRENNSH